MDDELPVWASENYAGASESGASAQISPINVSEIPNTSNFHTHVICESCLLYLISKDILFGYECALCDRLFDYRELVKYAKNFIICEAGAFVPNSDIANTQMAVKSLLLNAIQNFGHFTFIYSLGTRNPAELRKVVEFCKNVGNDEDSKGNQELILLIDALSCLIVDIENENTPKEVWKAPAVTVRKKNSNRARDKFLGKPIKKVYKKATKAEKPAIYSVLFLYTKSLAFPLESTFENDYEFYRSFVMYYRKAKKYGFYKNSQFYQAKILAVMEEPTSLSAAEVVKYLAPEILRTINMPTVRLKVYLDKFMERLKGIEENQELILNYAIEIGYCPVAENITSILNEYVGHDEFNIKQLLGFISRNAQFCYGGDPPCKDARNAEASKKKSILVFEKLISGMRNIYHFDNYDLQDVLDLQGLIDEYPAIAKPLFGIKNKIISSNYPQRSVLQTDITEKLWEIKQTSRFVSLGGLFTFFDRSDVSLSCITLFVKIHPICDTVEFRSFYFIDMVRYRLIRPDNSIEDLSRDFKDTETRVSYLNAIVFYLVRVLADLESQKEVLDASNAGEDASNPQSDDVGLNAPFDNYTHQMMIKYYESMGNFKRELIRSIRSSGNHNAIITYGFTCYYNQCLMKYPDTFRKYAIDLSVLTVERYNLMFRAFCSDYLETSSGSKCQRDFDFVMPALFSFMMNNSGISAADKIVIRTECLKELMNLNKDIDTIKRYYTSNDQEQQRLLMDIRQKHRKIIR